VAAPQGPTRSLEREDAGRLAHPTASLVPSASSALEQGVKGSKWFSLIDKVSRLDVLELAWAKVQSNAGACGVDGITVERFGKDSQERLLAVSEQIQRGAYQPQPVKRVWIPKPGSAEKRPLGIPTVGGRVVQTALRMVIEPIFERVFAEESFGFRPGRSCQDALRRVDGLLQSGHVHVVDIDIRGYFDAIPHERLMAEVREHIADGRVLAMIEAFLKAGVMGEMAGWEAESGTPQGGVISPLLANIYLNPLDWKLAQAGWEMVRYADDIVVLCRAPEEAARALETIRAWMAEAGLELHAGKTKIVEMAQAGAHFDFLGYRFWRGKAGKLRRFVRPKSRQKLRARIKPLTKRTNGESLEAIVAKLNPILRVLAHPATSLVPSAASMVRVLPARQRHCARRDGRVGPWASALDPAQEAWRKRQGERQRSSPLGQRLLCRTRTPVPAGTPGESMTSLRQEQTC
jgi:RNA-directed DNA polymerase